MAVTTWSELKTAVADWANRTDLTTVIGADLIPLCEAELKRRVRRSTTNTTIYISAANMNGPTDMASPVALRLDSSSPYEDKPLKLCTPEVLMEVRARVGDVTGRPTHYAFFDEQLQFAPSPDQSYDGILLYNVALTPLGSGAATNLILTEAPDAYIYGTQIHLCHYLEWDDRVPAIRVEFDRIIDELNKVRDDESYGGGLKEGRLPVVFG